MKVFFVLIAIFVYSGAVNAQTNPEIHGELNFKVGTTTIPIYPRGEGNNTHYEGGIKASADYQKFGFWLETKVRGGSTFDNPDGFDLDFGGQIKIKPSIYFTIEHRSQYALNHAIIRDSQSRRGGSPVNSWWLGLRYRTLVKSTGLELQYQHAFAGNEPLFYTHFTRPYAIQNASIATVTQITPRIFANTNNSFFFNNKLKEFRYELQGNLQIQTTKNVYLELSGRRYSNHGVPNHVLDFRGNTLRPRGGLFVGLVYKF